MDAAVDQMSHQDLPPELVREILDYYKHLFRTRGAMAFEDEGTFLRDLPEELQGRLLYSINYTIVQKVRRASHVEPGGGGGGGNCRRLAITRFTIDGVYPSAAGG